MKPYYAAEDYHFNYYMKKVLYLIVIFTRKSFNCADLEKVCFFINKNKLIEITTKPNCCVGTPIISFDIDKNLEEVQQSQQL